MTKEEKQLIEKSLKEIEEATTSLVQSEITYSKHAVTFQRITNKLLIGIKGIKEATTTQ